MKKIFKLALHESHIWYKLFLGFCSIFYTCGMLLNDSNETVNEDIFGTVLILIGCNTILDVVIMCVNGNSDIKLLKTLPLTSGNITDTFAVSTYMGVPIISLGVSVWHIVFGKAYMIPYFVCAFMISAAFGTVIMPLLVSEPCVMSGARRFTPRNVSLSLILIFASVAAGTLLCLKGYKNSCFVVEDVPMLIGIFAACIVLSMIITAVYRKKVKYRTAG
ncbi:MAG: hypothetical protein K2J73_02880 [Oscillospiraceae bacterium]|nr:hypothetical protein [Oscillospiraceae bacterium]